MADKVLVLSTRELNYIQEIMDKYSQIRPEYNKVCWYIIKTIDSQAGGNYPKNHTW